MHCHFTTLFKSTIALNHWNTVVIIKPIFNGFDLKKIDHISIFCNISTYNLNPKSLSLFFRIGQSHTFTVNQITFHAIFNIHRHLGVKNHSITYGLRLQSVLYKSRNFPESMVLNPPVHVWCSRHVLMIWTLRRIECNDTALTTIRINTQHRW